MSKQDNSGPAFPVPAEMCQDLAIEQQRGMTLRDYFAAKAMGGFATEPDFSWIDGPDGMARCAYKWADAMLKARQS
jgi:hypothetical protein